MTIFSDTEICVAASALLTEFCWRVDNREGHKVAQLFTEDATVDTPHFKLAGATDIDAWFSKHANAPERLSRHFWTNLRIFPEGPEAFVAHANTQTYVRGQPAPNQTVRYAIGATTDRIVRRGGVLLFAARKLDILFEGAMPGGNAG